MLSERKRIEAKGGFVDGNGRVAGRLGGNSYCFLADGYFGRIVSWWSVSRAFGDLPVKKYGVVAQPEIMKFTIGSGDEFLLIACDGSDCTSRMPNCC